MKNNSESDKQKQLELRVLKLEKDVEYILGEFSFLSPQLKKYAKDLKQYLTELKSMNEQNKEDTDWWKK